MLRPLSQGRTYHSALAATAMKANFTSRVVEKFAVNMYVQQSAVVTYMPWIGYSQGRICREYVVTVYGRMLGLENSYLTCESWVGFERESATGRRQPRFPPTVNLCELCVLICQQHT